MLTDPIADLLTRMRNAVMMRHEQVACPHSKFKEAVLKIFQQEGFIRGYETVGSGPQKSLVVNLKYAPDGQPVITTLRKISKLGRRVYLASENLEPFRLGLGMKILTTSKGILSDQEARKQKVGGEVLVEVW